MHLTGKQRRFIAEYLVDGNATRAAISAGYSEDTARQIAAENLTKPYIVNEIERRRKVQEERLQIRSDKVLSELAKIGFSNMLDYISPQEDGSFVTDFSAVSRDEGAAIQEVTVEEFTEGKGDNKREVRRTKFKLSDKRGSLELLGKHLKLFTDKHEFQMDGLSELTDEQLRQLANRLGIS